MKIACCQMNMTFLNKESNYDLAKKMFDKASSKNPDIIVYPEMWDVGFFPKNDLSEFADINGEKTKSLFGELCKKYKVNAVAGSVMNKKNDGKIYNTSFVFDRNGTVICEYDKCHLFSPMEEDKYFEKGKGYKTFFVDGEKAAVIICYDLRFPELIRSLALDGIKLIFVVAQWPKERIEQFKSLLKARAIENQIFAVSCNSCGKAEKTVYGGNSVAFDPLGNELYNLGGKEEVDFCECNFETVNKIRSDINVFNDRRAEIYNL